MTFKVIGTGIYAGCQRIASAIDTENANRIADALNLVGRIAARELWQAHYGKTWEDEASAIIGKSIDPDQIPMDLPVPDEDDPLDYRDVHHVRREGDEIVCSCGVRYDVREEHP